MHDSPNSTMMSRDPNEAQLASIAGVIVSRLHAQQAVRQQSPYLSVAEAATYLRCRRQRIYDLVSTRRLARYKDGRRVLISREELDAYLTRH